MRRPASPSRLRTSRGLSPHPKALPPPPSLLSKTISYIQDIFHHDPSSSQAQFVAHVNRQHFDNAALERWFECRRIRDWAHLAHHIMTSAPSSALNVARPEACIPPKRMSVCRRQLSHNLPLGRPVLDSKGKISHYEQNWTLPMEAVRCLWPSRTSHHTEEAAKRLICLLQVVYADQNVFAVLERGDREALVRYWTCTSGTPAQLKRSGLVCKMQRIDRKDDLAAREEEERRRKRRKDSFKPPSKCVGKHAAEVVRTPLRCERKAPWWNWYGRDPVEVERQRIQRLRSLHESRSANPRTAFECSREFHPFDPFY